MLGLEGVLISKRERLLLAGSEASVVARPGPRLVRRNMSGLYVLIGVKKPWLILAVYLVTCRHRHWQ